MSNPGMMLTALGRDVLAKGLLGKVIHFTKVSYGAGTFDYETEKVSDLTELRDWKMDLPIVGKTLEGNGIADIKARLNNFELLEGFPAREVGIFALDPDSGKEILYAYRNAGDEYTFIPAKTGPVHKDTVHSYRIEIQDAPNVTFNVIADFAYLPQTDYNEHVKAFHPHPNIPNHFDDVISTDAFWVTDFDNHLHKLPVSGAKQTLLAETSAKLNQAIQSFGDVENLIDTVNTLGIDPVLFVVEDFSDPLIDNPKIKVSSCAKGGNLIGLFDTDGLKNNSWYYISDGAAQEFIFVNNIIRNQTGYHAQAAFTLQNDYDLADTFLYRTTAKLGNTAQMSNNLPRNIKFSPREGFLGIQANAQQVVPMNTDFAKHTGFIVDGYFTL